MSLRVGPILERWRWRFLVLEACVGLVIATLMVRFVPLRVWIGDVTDAGVPFEPGPDTKRLASRVGAAVNRAAVFLPINAVCLPRALAARLMLRRRRLRACLHFAVGLHKEHPTGKKVRGHAWLTLGGMVVIGQGAPSGYARFDPVDQLVRRAGE